MAQCRYCQKEISWMKGNRRSIPIENDGSIHECQELKKIGKTVKTLNRNTLSKEEIAKYEKAVNESAKQKKNKGPHQ